MTDDCGLRVYKSHVAVVRKDEETGVFTGTVHASPNDILVFEADTSEDVNREFQIAVNAYEGYRLTHEHWTE